MAKGLIILAAFASAFIGAGYYDSTETNRSYHADFTFGGDRVIVERTSGKLGLRQGEEIVGYYLAGKPRVVAFGCEGATNPLIAMDEDLLPRCQRVEPIA